MNVSKNHFTKISISVLVGGNFFSFKRNWGIFYVVEGGSPISVIQFCRNINKQNDYSNCDSLECFKKEYLTINGD